MRSGGVETTDLLRFRTGRLETGGLRRTERTVAQWVAVCRGSWSVGGPPPALALMHAGGEGGGGSWSPAEMVMSKGERPRKAWGRS